MYKYGLGFLWKSPSFRFHQLRSIVQSSFAKNTNIKRNNNLPFKVTRTPSGNLAVYLKIRAHGTLVYTVVRHIYGDIEAMKEQLRILCESPVRERVGSLEVQGLHVKKIKKWLVSCGFVFYFHTIKPTPIILPPITLLYYLSPINLISLQILGTLIHD